MAPTAEVVGDFRRLIRKVHRAQVRANHTSLSVETLTPDAVIVRDRGEVINIYRESSHLSRLPSTRRPALSAYDTRTYADAVVVR